MVYPCPACIGIVDHDIINWPLKIGFVDHDNELTI